MPHPLPPYALTSPVFRFRHLAALAGRAPIGGAREVALACFVAARLAADCYEHASEEPNGRAERCAGAKAWLGTLAVPATVRGPVARCAELSISGSAAALVSELLALSLAAQGFLDPPSRAELDTLAATLRRIATETI